MLTTQQNRKRVHARGYRIRRMLPAGSIFVIDVMDCGYVLLDRITIPAEHRGQGHGTRALDALTKSADRYGWPLGLTVSDELGGDPARLRELYARFGFIDTTRYGCDMWREPRTMPTD